MISKIGPKVFRRDVNGLRAWAVISVIFFHFGVYGFRGGFIGVDVFFVISGFLMTQIILNGLIQETSGGKKFSVFKFYVSRARRIFPALIFVCVILLIVEFFLLTAFEYSLLGKHVFGALLFISNVMFWLEAGYFDTSSSEKFLLHTWSLSVEWQFYIAFPVFLAIFLRNPRLRNYYLHSLIVLFLASFFISIYLSRANASAGFYLLPGRIWEMLAGGGVYLISRRVEVNARIAKILEIFGFLLIIISIVVFDDHSPWPGWRALVPVVGAALVLFAARQDSFWTSTKLAQSLGSSSYSLYLWHWPIWVILRYANFPHTGATILVGCVTTVFFGGISYFLIENRSRDFLEKFTVGKSAYVLIATAMFVVIFGGVVKETNGAAFRLPEQLRTVANYKFDYSAYREGVCFLKPEQSAKDFGNCTEGSGKNTTLLWGDSHAAHLYPGFKKYFPKDSTLTQMTSSGCPPLIDMNFSTRKNCLQINNAVKDWIGKNKPDHVILAANWGGYDWARLPDTLNFLQKNGVTTIDVVGPVPEWDGSLPRDILKYANNNNLKILPDMLSQGLLPGPLQLDEKMRKMSLENHVNYESPIGVFCTEGRCLAMVGDLGKKLPVAWDYGHLTVEGSEYLVSQLGRVQPTAPQVAQ